MDQIRISLQELEQLHQRLGQLNQSMYEVLKNAQRLMNDLSQSWQSDGSESIRNRFNQFSLKFDTLKEQIETYRLFLIKTIETYDGLESTLSFNAQQLND